ncbi:MAG: thioredoxin domain-containing protein [Chthoniobacterales bacterium]
MKTEHKGAKKANRLGKEKSPYLLQHAGNPVDWYPWTDAAFAKARREKKPIFLSIGYSTCHWCHVMAHESFENEQTAEIMNREFVNIKVDREERPDVDRVYMTFVQATTGGGGWPMSVWLTPELKPFVGGTYFPPEDRYGQPGFKKVLQRIADTWKQDHEKIAEQGTRILQALQEAQAGGAGEGSGSLGREALQAAYEQLERSYDAREGGYGSAPKFPRPVTLNFMFRVYAHGVAQVSNLRAEDNANRKVAPQAEKALAMNLFTLRKMAAGGIHDHLGGGFHRYSVDGFWHVPHFEKMLYDQAQLAIAYLDAFQITHEPIFESTARDILDYVQRDMTHPDGGFFSAEDADSVVPEGEPEHAEGAFYVWTKDEIDAALGPDAEIFKFHYGAEPAGNAPEGADPHGEFTGKNILIERHTTAETAGQFKKNEEEICKILKKARAKLLSIRSKRPRPHRDDKIITAWNGLMISAFARAAQVLDEAAYLESARHAAGFVRAHLYDENEKALVRNFRQGKGAVGGFADDYAFLVQGLLDLYEASFDATLIQFALELQETQDRLFYDGEYDGYYGATANDPSILLRMKEDNDGAEPAASSVSALNLLRLAQLRNDEAPADRARKTINAFTRQISHFASAMPQMLVALDFSLATPRQIVIAGNPAAPETRALLREVHRHFLPTKILILADAGEGQRYLGSKLEALCEMRPVNGKAAAYVCENFTCQAPVTEPAKLRGLLERG